MKEEYLLTGALEPTNEPYAIAKIAAIKLCRYYNEQYGTNFISVMPTNLYGSGDNFNLETAHVLPALIRKFHFARLLSGKKYDEIARDIKRFRMGFGLDNEMDMPGRSDVGVLEKLGITAGHVDIWGSGDPYREFLYVDDLADACVYLMERCHYKDIGEFVNIGTGVDLKIRELATLVRDITGFNGEIRYNTSKPDGTPKKLLDISRIRSLGWQPKTGLEEGIKKTYEWYLSCISTKDADIVHKFI